METPLEIRAYNIAAILNVDPSAGCSTCSGSGLVPREGCYLQAWPCPACKGSGGLMTDTFKRQIEARWSNWTNVHARRAFGKNDSI